MTDLSPPAAIAARWRVFTATPHRMMFYPGAAQTVLVMLLWLSELLARTGLLPPLPTVIAPTRVHVFLMLYGLFPFFIFGFLFTVYPRWMNGPLVPTSRYVAAFLFLTAGMALFYTGLFTSRVVLSFALVVQLVGWGIGLFALLSVFRRAAKRGPHERFLNVALFAAPLGVLAFLYGVMTDVTRAFLFAREAGLWLFLVPVLFTVSHRMIPFFGSTALSDYTPVRPAWSLPLLAAGVIGHTWLETAGYPQWLFLSDAPLAFMGWHHTLLWKFRRSLEVRLLAMLHIAFLWFGIAMTLYTLQSMVLFTGGAWALGRAPLHALGIGFIAGMLVAMASRVTLGHSGRALEADRLTWRIQLGMSLAAMLRIAAEFRPGVVGNTLNVAAAVAWLACLLPWAWRYAPVYLRPRIDGKPG